VLVVCWVGIDWVWISCVGVVWIVISCVGIGWDSIDCGCIGWGVISCVGIDEKWDDDNDDDVVVGVGVGDDSGAVTSSKLFRAPNFFDSLPPSPPPPPFLFIDNDVRGVFFCASIETKPLPLLDAELNDKGQSKIFNFSKIVRNW